MHPVLFRVGPVTVYSYGLMVGLGFMAYLWLALRRARARGLPPDKIQLVAVVLLVGGLIGSRLGYVALHWDFYRSSLLEVLRLDHGGMIFYTGAILGLALAIFAAKRLGMPVLATADFMAPPFALAHAIGRIGCFLNGCCAGLPTDLPWGVAFPPESVRRHPTQLYEMGALVGIFFFLLWLERRGKRPGTVLFGYLLLYAGWRFLIDGARGDRPKILLGLTDFQWVLLPALALCGFLLWRLNRRQPRRSP